MRKINFGVLLVVLLVSLSFGLPHILMSILLGGYGNYAPLVVSNVSGKSWDEARGFGPRYREVYDGRLLISDLYNYEYKNTPSPGPVLPAFILGGLAHILGSLKNLFVFADFIFPAATFLITYLFLFHLTKNRLISVMAAVALIFGYRLISSFPPFTFQGFKNFLESIFNYNYGESPLEFSRLDTPEFTHILLILNIYFLHLAIQRLSNKFAFLSGIFLGSLFYSYIFYWPFSLSGAGLLCLIYIFKKEWGKAKILCKILSSGLLLSLPYWLIYFKFKLSPIASEYFSRSLLEPGYSIYIPVNLIFWSLFFFIFYRKRDDIFYLCASFFMGGVLFLNFGFITGTGFNITRHNWLSRDIYPWLILMLAITFNYMVTNIYADKVLSKVSQVFKKYHKQIAVFMIAFFIAYGFYTHARFSFKKYRDYTISKEMQDVFNWLNKNTLPDSVVISCSIERNELLPTYTHNNVFFTTADTSLSFAPLSEILERLYITYKFYGIGQDYLRFILKYPAQNLKDKSLARELDAKRYIFFVSTDQKFFKDNQIRDDFLNKIMSDFERSESLLNKQSLSRYRIDYLIYGQLERKLAKNLRLETDAELKDLFKKAYEGRDFSIYAFNNQ